jgi:hypothetical protein
VIYPSANLEEIGTGRIRPLAISKQATNENTTEHPFAWWRFANSNQDSEILG